MHPLGIGDLGLLPLKVWRPGNDFGKRMNATTLVVERVRRLEDKARERMSMIEEVKVIRLLKKLHTHMVCNPWLVPKVAKADVISGTEVDSC